MAERTDTRNRPVQRRTIVSRLRNRLASITSQRERPTDWQTEIRSSIRLMQAQPQDSHQRTAIMCRLGLRMLEKASPKDIEDAVLSLSEGNPDSALSGMLMMSLLRAQAAERTRIKGYALPNEPCGSKLPLQTDREGCLTATRLGWTFIDTVTSRPETDLPW